MAKTMTKAAEGPAPVYSLRPHSRRALMHSIDYHQKMADLLKDSDGKLSETHAEVCAQLQAIVDAAPVMSAVDVALARRTVRRVLH